MNARGERPMELDTVEMVVTEKTDDYVVCKVVGAGIIRSKQGINLPDAELSVETITPQDKEHIVWAAENDLDYVSLSFVRSADDIRQLKDFNEGAKILIKQIEAKLK